MSMESAELQHIFRQEMAAEDKHEWERMNDEVTELILAGLPVSALLRARAVNKYWKMMIDSPSFCKLHRRVRPNNPWLFVYCTNFTISSMNEGYALDPDTNRWFICPSVKPPSHSLTSMAGGVGGIIYSPIETTQTRLCYNHSLFVKEWKKTAEMSFSRNAPLVGFLESGSGSDSTVGKLIAVGGVDADDYEGDYDDLAVEIYDTVLNKWEVTKSLPQQFRGSSSRHWLSGAVWNQKFFALQTYSGVVASFDLQTKNWSTVRTIRPLKPAGIRYAYLLICLDMLILAGVCYPPELQGVCSFKLWLVDETTMNCKEVGVMPREFLSLFAKGLLYGNSTPWVVEMKCVSSGSLIYVFSMVACAEFPIVVCDISKGWNAWKKLPPLPSKGKGTDIIIGYCSCIPLDFALKMQ